MFPYHNFYQKINKNFKSMLCSSMVSVAAFGPGDPGSNHGWFAA